MYTLDFEIPFMNAACSLGFFPDPNSDTDLSSFGAFVTNPISLRPRKPANGTRQIDFPGGVLLHTGLPNPGISAAIKQSSSQWERASLPIIVHLLADNPKDVRNMSSKLEELGTVYAVEIGLRHDIAENDAVELIQAAAGELPIIANIPLNRAIELAQSVVTAGASVVSLAPPRGALPDPDGNLVSGRLYGPAIFPQALSVVDDLVNLDIPIIGTGGIYNQEQADTMLTAGALAVQLDTVLWRGGWRQRWSD